tara:strand:- start:10 stop:243 length:234 start_codon:yes stop_codon:yes gene_type:complete
MIKQDQERIFRYLSKRYDSYSASRQREVLDEILERLKESSEWNTELLAELVESLLEEGKKLCSVMATLDLLDIEERT